MEISGKAGAAIIAVVVIVLGGVLYALTKPKDGALPQNPNAAPSVAPPASPMSGPGGRPGGRPGAAPSAAPSAAPPAR